MSVPWSALQPGTVVDADLGLPPATVGREIQKHRPCLVLAPMPSLGLLMIVPISKPMSYTNVELEPDRGNGLTARCFGQCHQLRSIDMARVTKVRGRLDPIAHTRFKRTLARLLGL
ncbi:MAG: type II toxin-antitoxin system PemK/MazF family toxin [Flavobacteriales bacterium]|nr:type II toxin-antitoxin system PemK/MazF family toxin [Flavobacteriales bacterium]